MSKIRRGGHSAEGETLSAGRVEYLEAARAGAHTAHPPHCHHRSGADHPCPVCHRRSGVFHCTRKRPCGYCRHRAGTSRRLAAADRHHRPDAVAQMSGSFVEMGGDSCVVYSLGGTRLNSIQSGYARPALAAGKTRFVLYNRSGNELRVESRTQNLYTKTMDRTISLCAVADAGQVAVVTDSTDSVAKLTVYNSSMQQQLVWNLTSEQGTPLRMAFAPDSRRLAVAAVSAVGAS